MTTFIAVRFVISRKLFLDSKSVSERRDPEMKRWRRVVIIQSMLALHRFCIEGAELQESES